MEAPYSLVITCVERVGNRLEELHLPKICRLFVREQKLQTQRLQRDEYTWRTDLLFTLLFGSFC